MARRPKTRMKKQAGKGAGKGAGLQGLLFPLIRGLEESRATLLALIQDTGLRALRLILDEEAAELAGKKSQRLRDRRAHHWGSATTEVSLGGRRVQIERPRVRSKLGSEVRLRSLEELRRRDPLPERVMEQILLGVSTRGYERSLPEPPTAAVTRGASKSAASRQLVRRTREKTQEFLARPLDDVDLIAVMLDGLEVGDHTVVAALGVAVDGTKRVLGVWQGSTENREVCTHLLQNLLGRGLRIEGRILVIIDGGKALRAAVRDVLGDAAIVQRCQLHKMRNVRSHLPEKRHAYVIQTMRDAYSSQTVATARRKLKALARWLERNGEVSAAASLNEGLEETLTILSFNLSETLRRFFSTTNAVENLNGLFRDASRNVKRWRDGEMTQRWVGMAFADAETRFHRIKGHRGLRVLASALRSAEHAALEAGEKIA